MIVQAECKFHRLFRNDRIATFVDSTVSDAVSKVVQKAGLRAEVESTASVLPFQMQQNETDGDFLLARAREQSHRAHGGCRRLLVVNQKTGAARTTGSSAALTLWRGM